MIVCLRSIHDLFAHSNTQAVRRIFLTAAILLLVLAACGGGQAASIRLARSEGGVQVTDDKGKALTVREDLLLYGGYGAATEAASYAWMDLDSAKLAKMDESSQIAVWEAGQLLDISVEAGSLFFHVTEPLEPEETMTIRSSNMAVGIRGTCGWVRVDSPACMAVYIIEGTVTCTVQDPDTGEEARDTVTGGEMALLRLEEGVCQIDKAGFTLAEVPSFVLPELDEDLLAVLPEETLPPIMMGLGAEAVASGSCPLDLTWTLDTDGVLTISGEGRMMGYALAGDSRADWFREGLPPVRTVVIKEGVTSIGGAAFRDCATLTDIILPESVTLIEAGAFANCTALKALPLLDHVQDIQTNAFLGCTSLDNIAIPAHLYRVDGFSGCTGLTSVAIPEGVEEIGGWAFADCTSLQEVYIPKSVTFIGQEAFAGCDSLRDVYYGGTKSEFYGDIWFEYGLDDSMKSATIHYAE